MRRKLSVEEVSGGLEEGRGEERDERLGLSRGGGGISELGGGG